MLNDDSLSHHAICYPYSQIWSPHSAEPMRSNSVLLVFYSSLPSHSAVCYSVQRCSECRLPLFCVNT